MDHSLWNKKWNDWCEKRGVFSQLYKHWEIINLYVSHMPDSNYIKNSSKRENFKSRESSGLKKYHLLLMSLINGISPLNQHTQKEWLYWYPYFLGIMKGIDHMSHFTLVL